MNIGLDDHCIHRNQLQQDEVIHGWFAKILNLKTEENEIKLPVKRSRKSAVVEEKPKRKRRTKAEMEAVKNPPPEKPKRKRRTKADAWDEIFHS